jgi:hypothetical protein
MLFLSMAGFSLVVVSYLTHLVDPLKMIVNSVSFFLKCNSLLLRDSSAPAQLALIKAFFYDLRQRVTCQILLKLKFFDAANFAFAHPAAYSSSG